MARGGAFANVCVAAPQQAAARRARWSAHCNASMADAPRAATDRGRSVRDDRRVSLLAALRVRAEARGNADLPFAVNRDQALHILPTHWLACVRITLSEVRAPRRRESCSLV
eukprot:1572944-Prymnesium_polylepis.1